MIEFRLPLVAAFACLCVTVFAAPTRDVPVISDLRGGGAGEPYTIQSDGLGAYMHTARGSSGVESHIQSGGGYEIDVYYFTSNRRLSFDFTHEVAGTTTGSSPATFITVPARLITKCATGSSLLTMTLGQSFACSLAGRFDWNGRTFLTRMNGAEYPGSTQPSITCTAADLAGQCSTWTIEACSPFVDNTAACGGDVMTLMEEKTAKGKITEVKVGDYYMNFRITAHKQ
jgi:hypothetical protein